MFIKVSVALKRSTDISLGIKQIQLPWRELLSVPAVALGIDLYVPQLYTGPLAPHKNPPHALVM